MKQSIVIDKKIIAIGYRENQFSSLDLRGGMDQFHNEIQFEERDVIPRLMMINILFPCAL